MIITRYPNKAGLMRGSNMMRVICNKCEKERTHGYNFCDQISQYSMFICDACLADAKKEVQQGNI